MPECPGARIILTIMTQDDFKNLVGYEQFVNDRVGTSPAPAILDAFLPESGKTFPLAWKVVSRQQASFFSSDERTGQEIQTRLRHRNGYLLPVHPLVEARLPPGDLVRSGNITFSASYRTVFYLPDENGPLADWDSGSSALMFKLHLDEPLPGIPGDRFVTEDIIRKCVYLSAVLPDELAAEPLGRHVDVAPEFFGLASPDCGVIFRSVPTIGIVPGFSVYSRDSRSPQVDPIIVKRVRAKYGTGSGEAAANFGSDFALPLVRALIAGFRRGISLEMHAQNTLVNFGEGAAVSRVIVRDLEGTVVFNDYRNDRGLGPLGTGPEHKIEAYTDAPIARLFNRNLDHDLGRMFSGALRALRESGYFSAADHTAAVHSIRQVVRRTIADGDVADLGGFGRYLPYSRAPWGNGLRPGHYFRTLYR